MAEKYICMNHKESVIFISKSDEPRCPKCKKEEYVAGYSGSKKPNNKK